jgi:hypothetical protein
MTNPYRAMCAELVRRWYAASGDQYLLDVADAMDHARTLLAQPELPELTDEVLQQMLFDNYRGAIEFLCDAEEEAHLMIRNHVKFARAAIAADRARYDRPTPQPEPPDADAQQLQQIAHAASDYLCGKQFPSFAEEHGGLDLLEAQLARLLAHFEHGSRPVRALLLMRARVSHQSSLSHQAGD